MDTLKERLQWVLKNRTEEVVNASQWSLASGLNRIHVGKLIKRAQRTNEGHVELDVINRLAATAKVPPSWLAYGVGTPDDDPKIGTLLLRLRQFRGLEDTIAKYPERWRTSTVIKAMATPFQSDSDGIPMGGWVKALDTLEQASASFGDANTVTIAARRQIGPRPTLPGEND